MKRTAALLLAGLLLLSCAGCSGYLDEEYVYTEPHTSANSNSDTNAALIIDNVNYDMLVKTISRLVSDQVSYGVIRANTYDGDIEADISAACMEVVNDTALGAYSVYYIDHSVYKVVSYYEMSFDITYKRTRNEVASIVDAGSVDALYHELENAAESCAEKLTVRSSLPELTESGVTEILERLYYTSPEKIIFLPSVSVTSYPEETAGERIVEISLKYPNTPSIARMKGAMLSACADVLLKNLKDERDDALIRALCTLAAESIHYDEYSDALENDRTVDETYTAYGAIVSGRAASEGMALALKLLCDRLDIDCTVVKGRMDNLTHAWNIIRFEDGDYYHVDLSRYEAEGGVHFRTDLEMVGNYRWDAAAVPDCQGEPMSEPGRLPVGIAQMPEQSAA